MSSDYRPPSGIEVAVEQAIAAGEDLDRICERLHVDTTVVDAVLRNMDLAVAYTDSNARGNPHLVST